MNEAESRPRTSGLGRAALAALVAGYVALAVVAGAPDSPLVPVLPGGVHPSGWLVGGARWTGLADLTRAQLTAVAIGLIGWLLAAFGALMVQAWRGRVRLWAVLAAAAVAVGLAVAAPVLLSRDLYSYAAYGRILAVHGSNPYAIPPSAFRGDPFVAVASPEWLHTRSVYGPAFTLLSAGIARSWSGSAPGTVLAFKVVAGAAVAGAAVAAAVAARMVRPGRESAAAAAVGLNPVLVLHTVGGGHNDALIALLLAGGFALAVAPGPSFGPSPGDPDGPRIEPDRHGTGPEVAVTVLLTLAMLVKAVVGPLLVVWAWQVWRRHPPASRWRTMGVHAGLAAAVTIALVVPVQSGWSTVRALLSVTSRQGWASGPGLVARGGRALGRAVGSPVTGSALDVAASVLFAALFLLLLWRVAARSPRVPDADGWGGSMLLLALAAPYLLPWYAAWFVPFLGLMGDPVLAAAGLGTAGLLALTGVPAEAESDPGLWRAMVLAVHDVAAPMMLVLLGVVAARLASLYRRPSPGAGGDAAGTRTLSSPDRRPA